jgi:DNA-binding GntR family transcriptional regulator
MIRDGELPRGSRIQQDVLAEMFNTSITPVREALVLLEAEGLLVGEPNRGVSVADADFSAIKAVYIQRMLLEPYAMRRATRRISHRDLDRAADLLDRMTSASKTKEVVSVPELNRQFHFLFYDACGNEALSTQIEQLWQRWPWDLLSVIKERPNESQKEHAEMILAVRSGNVEQVALATEQHLRASYMSLGKHLTGEKPEDVFDLDVD